MWHYRQAINISSHTTAESNVYIIATVNIGTTTKAQIDDGDFRFTDQNGNLLPYYISANAGTTAPTFHIQFTSFPAGAQTIYAYYGNQSAPNGFSTAGFTTQATNYTVGSLSAEELSPAPIAYWKFDEGVGSTAYDSMGSNNGTLAAGSSAPTWADESQCISGKCLSFDGTNDYITMSNVNLGSTNGFTVSFWINPLTYSNTRMPLSFRDSSSNWFRFFQDSSNNTGGTFETDQSPGEIGNKRTKVDNNEWQHIVITWNGTSLNTYKNGVVYQNTVSAPFTFGSFATLYLGSYNGQNYFYNGLLDDIKFYNYARTADQIKQDYNSRGSASAQGSSVNLGVRSNTAPTIKSKLIGYWKFDEGNGTIVNNSGSVASSLNGTFGTGSSAPTWTNDGKFGKALSFSSNQYINCSSNVTSKISGDYSISTWFNAGNISGSKTIVSFGQFMDLMLLNSSLKFEQAYDNLFSSGYIAASPSILNANTWYHLTAIYKKDNGVWIYLNGKLVASSTTKTGTNVNIGGNTYIGAVYDLSSGYYFTGLIDEVKIYNYALTPEEIKQDYNRGSVVQFGTTNQTIGSTTTSLEYCIPGDTSPCSAPIAEYRFDEGVGTSVVDISGNNKILTTFTGSPSWKSGKIGGAIKFNGGTDKVGSTSTTAINRAAGTMSMWIKATSFTGSTPTLYDTNGYYWLHFNSNSGTLLWNGGNSSALVGPTLSIEQWYFITITWGNTERKIYINGIYQVGDTTIPGYDPSNDMYIGNNAGSIYPFQGTIDQIHIYNYARTPAQIAYDYNKGGPVGWWKFDECQGNIAYDWSGIGNTGVINIGTSGTQNSLGTCAVGTSAAWANGASGKINSSLNFDGVDDYVEIASNLGILQNYTIAFWAKHNVANKMPFASRVNTSFYWYGDNSWRYIHGSSSEFYYPKSVNIPYGTWGHFVVTYDGAKVRIYRNGVFEGSQDSTGTANFSNGFLIGQWTGSTGYQFNGQIDDIRIYNYALTSEQIKTIYNGGAVNFR